MAKIVQSAKVETSITFTVNEEEARALDALAGYGDDAFIKAFYEHLRKHYMQPHERGLRSFLVAIRAEIPVLLLRADNARKAFTATLSTIEKEA